MMYIGYTSSLHNFALKMTGNQSWNGQNNQDISTRVLAYLLGAFEKLTKNGRQAADHIKQQLMIASIVKGTEQKTVELGGSPDFEVRRAYFQQHESNKTIGHLISQMLPSIKNVLEALLYCLFIIMVPMLLLPGGGGLLVFYFKILLWLQLWSPLFAFLNFIMTEAMSWQAISALKGDDGITIGNFVGLTNMTNDMASIAGYLCTMIPVLSWAIMDRGGYAIVNMASGLLGVAQGAGTQAAIEKVTGNYSYGNTSFGNQQLLTASHLRQDHTPSYSGHGHMMNDGSTSMLTSSSGEKVLTMQESHIPVSLNVAQTQEHALRESQRDLYNFAESEQKSSQSSLQQSQNHYLEIGKQAQHLFSSGVQISDQQQAQSLREAADHYSRVEQISNSTGLNREYANQLALDVSGGLSFSKLIGNIGATISKSEQSNMNVHDAANSIFDLGKTTQFNQSHQRMDNAFKSKSLDVNDQNLKQSINNFSSSHETAKRYEESANKSFEKARSLDHEIAFTQNNASSINASHNQEFVDHVGADELKRMNVQEQQRKAYNYMQNQMNLETYLPRHNRNNYSENALRSDYQLSNQDKSLATPDNIQKSHKDFEKGDYKKQSVEGANQREAYLMEKKVNQMFDNESEKINEAESQAKRQHFQAHQTFQRDHYEHAEDHMGFTQEGVTKEQLKKHKEKKNG